MRVINSFDTIQGEGRHVGLPVHLIRLFGCNLNCSYCDSTFAIANCYTEICSLDLFEQIKGTKAQAILWTGGEPTIQLEEIFEFMSICGSRYEHHIETNCTNLDPRLSHFNYISFSPKNINVLRKVRAFAVRKLLALDIPKYDIKVVTDLRDVGMDMIEEATMLMPLTTFNKAKDLEIKKRVWDYCSTHGIRYSPRAHIDAGCE